MEIFDKNNLPKLSDIIKEVDERGSVNSLEDLNRENAVQKEMLMMMDIITSLIDSNKILNDKITEMQKAINTLADSVSELNNRITILEMLEN